MEVIHGFKNVFARGVIIAVNEVNQNCVRGAFIRPVPSTLAFQTNVARLGSPELARERYIFLCWSGRLVGYERSSRGKK